MCVCGSVWCFVSEIPYILHRNVGFARDRSHFIGIRSLARNFQTMQRFLAGNNSNYSTVKHNWNIILFSCSRLSPYFFALQSLKTRETIVILFQQMFRSSFIHVHHFEELEFHFYFVIYKLSKVFTISFISHSCMAYCYGRWSMKLLYIIRWMRDDKKASVEILMLSGNLRTSNCAHWRTSAIVEIR